SYTTPAGQTATSITLQPTTAMILTGSGTTPPPPPPSPLGAPTAHLIPAPNGAGWNKADVTVSFTASGDSGGGGVVSCTSDQHVTSETTGTVVSGSCTDVAGN